MKLARLDVRDSELDAAQALAEASLARSEDLNLLHTAVQAQELLGDVALAREDPRAATLHFSDALSSVRSASRAGKEATLEIKLVTIHLDAGGLDAAAPLLGALVLAAPTAEALMVQARFSHLNGQPDAAVGALSSMLKTRGSEVKQRITELAARAVAHYALPFQPAALNPYADVSYVGPQRALTAMPTYMNERAATIYSGASEVQRDVLAKRVLGL
ncbi:MAG: acyl-CoA dehydrogenase family protein [Pseudomonadales bacterium]|nr:acyl-CoA dehydrogenase family protein [Pseudomonadales bacterium]MDP6828280.1 acyl-CoA dehydrogenase family protein [Pseudomonadales bacterium]